MVLSMQGSSIPDLFSMDQTIPQKICDAITSAVSCKDGICLDLSGVRVHVMGDSDPSAICTAFVRAYYHSGNRNVCPYPDPRVCIHEEFLCRCRVEEELSRVPHIRLVQKAVWAEFVHSAADPCDFGKSIVRYTARWARLMQYRGKGRNIEQLALKTSFEVDFDNIRDIALPIAVVALRSSWVHGASLLHASLQFARYSRLR